MSMDRMSCHMDPMAQQEIATLITYHVVAIIQAIKKCHKEINGNRLLDRSPDPTWVAQPTSRPDAPQLCSHAKKRTNPSWVIRSK
jgi:hypothetical protein